MKYWKLLTDGQFHKNLLKMPMDRPDPEEILTPLQQESERTYSGGEVR